jgi:hypothetical protein
MDQVHTRFFNVMLCEYVTRQSFYALDMFLEANPFMPDSENMRTYIASSGTDAASKALSKELNRIHQRVEDNLSSIGE